MADTRLGRIIRSLELRNVDNVTAHRGSSDKTSISEILKLVAKQVGALFLLSSPMRGSSTSAVPGGIKVGLNNIQVVLNGAINGGTLGPWNASVGDENIQAAIEVLDGLIDDRLGFLLVAQVTLVCLGW